MTTVPSKPIAFKNISENTYGYDINNDGVIQPEGETFVVETSFEEAAKKFVEAHPEKWTPKTLWKYEITSKNWDTTHVKNKFRNRLETEIKELQTLITTERLDAAHPYSQLLSDLKNIAGHLDSTGFVGVGRNEIPEGFAATYNPTNNSMQLREDASMPILVHEMDHALTDQQRTGTTNDSFVVKQDYGTPTSLTYSLANEESAFKPTEGQYCPNTQSKESALANETRAYLTMCRYVLFKLDISPEELKVLSTPGQASLDTFEKLLPRLVAYLETTELNPIWTAKLLAHYFGQGGESGRENLPTYVLAYYKITNRPQFQDECVGLTNEPSDDHQVATGNFFKDADCTENANAEKASTHAKTFDDVIDAYFKLKKTKCVPLNEKLLRELIRFDASVEGNSIKEDLAEEQPFISKTAGWQPHEISYEDMRDKLIKSFTRGVFSERITEELELHPEPQIATLAAPLEEKPAWAKERDRKLEELFDEICAPSEECKKLDPQNTVIYYKIPLKPHNDWANVEVEVLRGGTSYKANIIKAIQQKFPERKLLAEDIAIWLDPAIVAIQLKMEKDGLPRPSVREATLTLTDMLNSGELDASIIKDIHKKVGDVVEFKIW